MHRSRLPVSRLVPALFVAAVAPAQLTQQGQFAAGGSTVGCAFAPATSTVFVYPSFGASILAFSTTGAPLGQLTRPGGSANDADLAVAPVAFALGGTPVPAGSLLYVDGETGPAEIYAMDPASGAVLATLSTSFGNDHVVGGAFHPLRGTFFLVQDRVPGTAAERNRVGEVDPTTGAVLNTWQVTASNPAFTVNYGDLDVTPYGNLLIVSSDEVEIGEFTPAGAWVAGHPLPTGVASLCGIGRDGSGCGLWVAANNGTISQLAAVCPSVATVGTACPSSGGSNTFAATTQPWAGSTFVATATGLPQLGFALIVTGLTALPAPLPVAALLPQGQPGCSLYVSPDAVSLLLAANGTAVSRLALPPNPAFAGASLFQQMGVVEVNGGGTIVAVTSTNALRATVGSY